ncbi:MAG TPA: dihydropteroate synthase [Nannocystis exedens]|nr:dihydropteroate synthase [Nannocystis exedens]
MAIVNLTPDSFFDGGHLMPEEGVAPNLSVATKRARGLCDRGADILDLGGESTRPGAKPVSSEVEIRRVLPVLRRLVASERRVPISVDTRRAAVARRAVDAGAAIINDISGLADPEMASVVAESGAGLVISHLRGEPATMQTRIKFRDLFAEITDELGEMVAAALRAGVCRSQIVVDPGIGFGKNAEQSAALVIGAAEIEAATGCPVLIGASRKSFLGALTGRPVEERREASVVAAIASIQAGAALVRVHDVGPTVDALRLLASFDAAYTKAREVSA